MGMSLIRSTFTRRVADLVPLGSTVALAAISLAACGKAPATSSAAPTQRVREVGVVTLKAERVTLTAELSGRTNPFAIAEVRPQISGLVLKRLFNEGANVTAGQALYQIDASTYQAARDQAAAQLASSEAAAAVAESKAKRSAALRQREANSVQEFEDSQAAARQTAAAVQQARANLKTAEINLARTRIVAPITGKIGRSTVTQGALVTANQTEALATIWQLNPIYVDITQSSAKLLQVRKALGTGKVQPSGTDVRLSLDDGSPYPAVGHVEFSETAVDVATGAVTIRARFPNPDQLLLPGMFVRVTVPQGDMPEGVLAPQQGISRDPSGTAVAMVVGPDNKVEGRKIVAERTIGDKWLVSSGLKAGDRLIVEGTDKVKPGQIVKPVAPQPPAPPKPKA